jgi:hypothetical protein
LPRHNRRPAGEVDSVNPMASSAAGPTAEQESLRLDMFRMGISGDRIAAEFSRRYKLHPRQAYRIACGLTLQEAVDRFNAYAARTELRKKPGLTVEELQRYETAPEDGSPPPLATLDLLAQVYGTDMGSLVDFHERMNMLPRERELLGAEARVGPQSGQSISALIIGQATALLALGVAVIYAAGDLELGFSIWFIRDAWAPILGVLPQTLILTNAISDVIPALILAVPVYYIYRKCYHLGRKRDYRLTRQAFAVFISTTVLSLITGLVLTFTSRSFKANVLRPWPEIIIACFVINAVVIGLALFALWLIDDHSRSQLMRRILGVGVTGVALIPFAGSAYAAFPWALPPVVLCGPGFYYTDSNGRHYMEGNLIGNSGQSVYVAETRTINGTATGHYISVVPLSAVQDETIGASAECHNLAQVPGDGRPVPSQSATSIPAVTRNP